MFAMRICDSVARILIGKAEELKPGTMRKVAVEGKDDIVVANVNGSFYAMRGVCNHAGGPLADGEIDGNVITCPWHGSRWDVTTGKLVEFAIELDDEPTYKVAVEGDELFLEV
jgi:3-phenylpropionate/trans-cinnamate dioxygenase ferredoxin component